MSECPSPKRPARRSWVELKLPWLLGLPLPTTDYRPNVKNTSNNNFVLLYRAPQTRVGTRVCHAKVLTAGLSSNSSAHSSTWTGAMLSVFYLICTCQTKQNVHRQCGTELNFGSTVRQLGSCRSEAVYSRRKISTTHLTVDTLFKHATIVQTEVA